MPELSAPIRLTWDLPSEPERAARLWGRIVEGRVLFVDVRIPPNSLGGLAGLASGPARRDGPRLSLLGDAEALSTAVETLGAQALRDTGLLLLPPYRPDLPVQRLVATNHRLVPSLWSTPQGLGFFAEAVELARAHGLHTVAVLNPPAPAAPLGEADRAAAARTWREHGDPGVALRVHDLFLAEALGLEPFKGYAGCQAGDTLAHLTAEGRLVACRTLAVDLGDLSAEPLADLWASETRRSLRKRLSQMPHACEGCSLACTCMGGCRGLSERLGRDPSCPGRRDVEAVQGGLVE